MPVFSTDGSLVYNSRGEGVRNDIFYLKPDDVTQPHAITQTPVDEGQSTLSPDGRFVAYREWGPGQDEIFIKRFPSGEGRWKASVGGGRMPRWSQDGGELFYVQDDALMTVAVKTRASPSLSPPQKLFSASTIELGYDVDCFCFQDSARRAHSIAAQGGINAAKNYPNDGDSVYRLFYDTIAERSGGRGDGLGNRRPR